MRTEGHGRPGIETKALQHSLCFFLGSQPEPVLSIGADWKSVRTGAFGVAPKIETEETISGLNFAAKTVGNPMNARVLPWRGRHGGNRRPVLNSSLCLCPRVVQVGVETVTKVKLLTGTSEMPHSAIFRAAAIRSTSGCCSIVAARSAACLFLLLTLGQRSFRSEQTKNRTNAETIAHLQVFSMYLLQICQTNYTITLNAI